MNLSFISIKQAGKRDVKEKPFLNEYEQILATSPFCGAN